MRFSKRYSGDIASTLIQKDITKYARIGVVESVDAESGFCTIRWYDKPAYQKDVVITQSFPGGTAIPEKGSVVVAVLDQFSRAFIVGYINLGHENSVKKLKTLPKLKPGEKFFEAGGSYIHVKRNGSVVLSTLTGGIVEFSNVTQTWKYEVVNWKLITDAGTNYFGVVKRAVLNPDGSKSVTPIGDLLGNLYTEYSLTLYENADGSVGLNPTQTPILEMTLGTVVDTLGNPINSKNIPELLQAKQLVTRLKLKSGVVLDIDKEGKMSLRNVSFNINDASVDINDVDVTMGVNNPAKGEKGQHIAREHDRIDIPLAASYTDKDHLGQTTKAAENSATLATAATAFVSPMGPCFFNPGILINNEKLTGEITQGAPDAYLGGDTL